MTISIDLPLCGRRWQRRELSRWNGRMCGTIFASRSIAGISTFLLYKPTCGVYCVPLSLPPFPVQFPSRTTIAGKLPIGDLNLSTFILRVEAIYWLTNIKTYSLRTLCGAQSVIQNVSLAALTAVFGWSST